jgi:hypothetical protein
MDITTHRATVLSFAITISSYLRLAATRQTEARNARRFWLVRSGRPESP